MNITQEQAVWIAENLVWVFPSISFIFVSLVLGFWKLIGKLFSHKKKIPHSEGEVTSPEDSGKQEEPTAISKNPPAPVELDKEGYMVLKK